MKTLPKGHKSVFDPAFKYVPAASTDIRHTFIRELARQQNLLPELPHLTVVKKRKP